MEPKDDDVAATAVRPFLNRSQPRGGQQPIDAFEIEGAQVRAYAMTRGRAHAAIHLEFETMLKATPGGTGAAKTERFERADILRLCRGEPLSVAELSARLHIPIGVVRVVAADLMLAGLLVSFQPSENVADDVILITRLIAGVRAL